MKINMHLQFKFTDRSGRAVYEMFAADDNKRMEHSLGTVRISEPDNQRVSWARVDWLDANPADDEVAPEQLELNL